MLRVVKRGGKTYNPPSSVALFVKTNVSLAKFFCPSKTGGMCIS